MFIVTLTFGPEVPTPGRSPLVFGKTVLAADVGVALKAYGEQPGVAWVDLVSAIPVDLDRPFTELDL